MGLDITAYSKLEKIADIPRKPDGKIDWEAAYEADEDVIVAWSHEGFPDTLRGLEEGVYKSRGDTHGFRAGSYSGYNRWRRDLAQIILGVPDQAVWAHPEDFEGKPFLELINFSDCEGGLGPQVSAKLYQDFVDNEARFLKGIQAARDCDVEWYLTKYQDWKRAFEIARDGGMVKFH